MTAPADPPPGGRISALLDRVAGYNASAAAGSRRSRFGAVLAVIWLGYLIPRILQDWREADQPAAAAETAILLGYAVLIVAALTGTAPVSAAEVSRPGNRRVWPVLAGMGFCVAALVALFGATAVPTALYLAVVAVFRLTPRASGWICLAVSLAILLPPPVVPGPADVPWSVAFVPAVIWVLRQVGVRGARLTELARRQQAELAVAAERDRVARDVHDILGHSLTVITVKTELARRLLDIDIDRARTELADVEDLARDALSGVRDTVGGLREVTLRGELANARSALAAADIAADLPDPSRLPPGEHELFGWVLRESITNVVRHSAARHCAVTVSPTRIEVVDDGRGLGAAAAGSGLTGLRERAGAAGAVLTVSEPAGGGVRVVVAISG
ncbi:histidine kinase [Nocardia sp. NPDC024068]|uniref:sensor histidine kinase n=1 Tax=Nocardia sp. NPDC024068 TaxID=3157197 RepID=UPI0033CF04E6